MPRKSIILLMTLLLMLSVGAWSMYIYQRYADGVPESDLPPSPPPVVKTPGTPAQLTCTITLEKTTFHPQDVIVVQFFVTNTGTEDYPDPASLPAYELRYTPPGSKRSRLAEGLPQIPSFVCGNVGDPYSFEGGATRTFYVWLNNTYNVARVGTYTLLMYQDSQLKKDVQASTDPAVYMKGTCASATFTVARDTPEADAALVEEIENRKQPAHVSTEEYRRLLGIGSPAAVDILLTCVVPYNGHRAMQYYLETLDTENLEPHTWDVLTYVTWATWPNSQLPIFTDYYHKIIAYKLRDVVDERAERLILRDVNTYVPRPGTAYGYTEKKQAIRASHTDPGVGRRARETVALPILPKSN